MCTYFPFTLYVCYAFEKNKNISKDFLGISSANPHESSLAHLDNQRVKGLVCAKCNHNSYKQKLGVGAFVSMIYNVFFMPLFI